MSDSPSKGPRLIVMMGVSGAGKTFVGTALATALGWPFYDADDYHSAANIEKMRRGEGLTDADRAPWLAALGALVALVISRGDRGVLACSALKQSYRDGLIPHGVDASVVQFVYLDVPPAVLAERLATRPHHFAPPKLLGSQLETLEKPADALWVDGTCPVGEIVQRIRTALGLTV